jgi:hypothetical protein
MILSLELEQKRPNCIALKIEDIHSHYLDLYDYTNLHS